MYRIAVLSDREAAEARYVRPIAVFCEERRLFPRLTLHRSREAFFQALKSLEPTNVVVALSGVEGLNAAEQLRGLRPDCGLIWCSELDFSIQAFRLRADYFLLEPVTPEALRRGLGVWFERTRGEIML